MLEDSQPYLYIYQLCGNQYITGPAGAIGLNWLAFESMARRAGVPEDELLDFWNKISLISSEVLTLQYKEQERKQQIKK